MRLSCIVLFLIITTVAGRGRFGGRRSFGSSSRSFGSSSRSFGSSSRSFGSTSHKYPVSHGYSGHGSGGAHTYPGSPGLSGNHVRQTPHIAINHYHYRPPQQINYGSTFHPVYQGHPPVYVYEYRDSGSRFDNLLTGLALYNLGRNSHSHSSDRQYRSNPGEICKLGISKRSGEYEETRIDCNLMSSFIWQDTTTAKRNEQPVVKNTTVVTVTQTVNGTRNSSVTTVTVTSKTVEDALKVKGPSIAVTPGMTCYMIRTVGAITALRKPVDCGLLQEYARSSLHRSVAQCLMSLKTIIFYFSIILCLVRY